MSEDQFTKLFKHMENGFYSIEKRFDMVDSEIADVRGAVAELGGQIRDYHQELVMMGRKMDRLERFINQIAQETGVKLDFLAD